MSYGNFKFRGRKFFLEELWDSLDGLENSMDGIEEFAGPEDLSEAIVEKRGDEKPHLAFNGSAMGQSKAIRQRVFAIGTQHRKRSGAHGLSSGVLRTATLTEQGAMTD